MPVMLAVARRVGKGAQSPAFMPGQIGVDKFTQSAQAGLRRAVPTGNATSDYFAHPTSRDRGDKT